MKSNSNENIMAPACHQCSICDGKACRGLLPGMGSAGTGQSFVDNYEDLQKIKLRIKVLSTFSNPDTSIEFLGFNLSMPLLGAPVASVALNMGGSMSEEAYILKSLKECSDSGILGSTGDGLSDSIYQAGFKAIAALDGQGIPFIKPWDDPLFNRKLRDAIDSGAKVIGIDVDAIGLTILGKYGMATKMRSQSELKALISRIPLPVILKGIMTADEAEIAIACGAAAIIVSNHGGRLTDAAPSTISVLPEISRQVDKRLPIIIDGGIRSGEDILRVLASGADLAMIGRPFAIKTLTSQEGGLEAHLLSLRESFEKAMILTGCHTLDDINESLLNRCAI